MTRSDTELGAEVNVKQTEDEKKKSGHLKKKKKAGTDQSGDEGNPKVPEVLVEQPAVHHVTKQSNGSWFAQTTSWLGFCK